MSSLWRELRRDFPALSRYVYLDAAAASPVPRVVGEAVSQFYRDLGDQGDRMWNVWIERVEEVRRGVARWIGADVEEIAFVPNTSTGINLIVDLLEWDGDVLSDELEFPTVTLPWIHRGVGVHLLAAPRGVVRPEDFAVDAAPRAATIAISHVQFSNGCRQDLASFAAVKGERRLVVSASQSCGAFPIDVARDGVDALASAGHKWLCAGYGAGFVYVSRELLRSRPPRAVGWLSGENPFDFDNRTIRVLPGNRRTEMGCPPFPQILALGAAVDYLSQVGSAAIAERVLELNSYLTLLLERAGFRLLSPGGPHRSGETLVALGDARTAGAFLRSRGVIVTVKPQGLRIATHFYNNESDIEACVATLREFRALTPRG